MLKQALLISCVSGMLAVSSAGCFAEAPRLVLQITVDQLRADLPERISAHWGKKGFRYLYEQGLVYRNAHHAHANTETIVGHTTLATGAYPSVHGMIGNVWFDRQLGRQVYNIEDADYHLLSRDADVDAGSEIDPTQKVAKSDGRSPRAIRVSTLADQIAIASDGKAKVFGVSVKDRGAVAMAGHAGKAFWFSKSKGEFVSSNYYYDRYPAWVSAWNRESAAARYSGKAWTLTLDESDYLHADSADWETDFPGYGNTFPHAYGDASSRYYTTLLTLSPAGDELTADFAIRLIDEEAIGADSITDYLSVSFSSTDYVGHLFGPASREAEDNLIRLDRTLERLLAHVDRTVGLNNVLVVFSADHGAAEVAGYLESIGVPAGNIALAGWPDESVRGRIAGQLGTDVNPIHSISWPYIYLDHDAIDAAGLDRATVARAVANEAAAIDGILRALTDETLTQSLLEPAYMRLAANNQAPGRSGDIYLVSQPNWFVADFDGLSVASTHGSPWEYDRHVPVIFAGNRINKGSVNRAIDTVDVAPAVSAYLGIGAPSGSAGTALPELPLRQHR